MSDRVRDVKGQPDRVANKRLANKVLWGIEDGLATCRTMRGLVNAAMSRADEKMDARMLLHLVRIQEGVLFIEKKLRDAQQGEYEDRGFPAWIERGGRGR